MTDVTLFGERRCHKVQYYAKALDERGVDYELAAIEEDPIARNKLAELYDGELKFPTLLIKGRKVRNPKLSDLDKELARAELYDPGLIHDERSQRFIRYMVPQDAFVSYSLQGDRMVLGHIEVSPSLRGRGTGARLAIEVLTYLENKTYEIRITCPFLRRVAMTRSEWREKFSLKQRGTTK